MLGLEAEAPTKAFALDDLPFRWQGIASSDSCPLGLFTSEQTKRTEDRGQIVFVKILGPKFNNLLIS